MLDWALRGAIYMYMQNGSSDNQYHRAFYHPDPKTAPTKPVVNLLLAQSEAFRLALSETARTARIPPTCPTVVLPRRALRQSHLDSSQIACSLVKLGIHRLYQSRYFKVGASRCRPEHQGWSETAATVQTTSA
jgi:hypothetical protein